MSRMLRLLLSLLATAALVLTGCGGDDDDDGADAAADTETEAGDEAGEGDDESSEDVELDDVAGMSEDCMAAFAAFSDMASSAGFTAGDSDPEESLEQFRAFAEAAPEEIRDDLELLGDAYARVVAVMVETGYDPQSGEAPDEETMAALSEAVAPLSTDEVSAASERVSAYFSSECGIGNE